MPAAASESRRAATESARPSSRRAKGAGKTTKAGTSATKTGTAPSGRGQNTVAVTAAPHTSASSLEDHESGEVAKAVARDLAQLAARDPELARSGLAMTALALGRQVDSAFNGTAASNAANALVSVLKELRELSPAEEESDAFDELTRRRNARLTG